MPKQPMTYADHFETISFNVGLGNDYRKEWIKHAMTLAAGVFAFTVTFYKEFPGVKDLAPDPTAIILMCLGWAGMIASLYFGIAQLRGWEDFYMTFRNDPKAYIASDEASDLRDRVKHLPEKDADRVKAEEAAKKIEAEGLAVKISAVDARTTILRLTRVARWLQIACLMLGLATMACGFGYDLFRASAAAVQKAAAAKPATAPSARLPNAAPQTSGGVQQ